jgi:predicted dehydrogenase
LSKLRIAVAGAGLIGLRHIEETQKGKRLVQTAERSNAKLLVGHHRPHSPILHKAVETIKSGILGPIVAVIGSAVFYKPEGY